MKKSNNQIGFWRPVVCSLICFCYFFFLLISREIFGYRTKEKDKALACVQKFNRIFSQHFSSIKFIMVTRSKQYFNKYLQQNYGIEKKQQ